MKNIFVYGTLIFPEIVFALTGKNFKTQNATLEGYRRYKIFDDNIPRRYPAIAESEGHKVEGKILFEVDEESLKILDFFEEEDYFRKELTVLTDNDRKVSAFVYLWNSELKEKLKSDWSPEEFEKEHLQEYVLEVIPKVLDEYSR